MSPTVVLVLAATAPALAAAWALVEIRAARPQEPLTVATVLPSWAVPGTKLRLRVGGGVGHCFRRTRISGAQPRLVR